MKSRHAVQALMHVKKSPVHGQGVFATSTIRSGAVIGTYAGRRYSASQVQRRRWDVQLTYVFGLSDGTVIDGAENGNETRHFNHACEPNCEAIEQVDGRGRIQIQFATLRQVERKAHYARLSYRAGHAHPPSTQDVNERCR